MTNEPGDVLWNCAACAKQIPEGQEILCLNGCGAVFCGPCAATYLTVLPGTKRYPRRWAIGSLSDPAKNYIVAVDAAGVYDCSCPQWRFRRLSCTHIAMVKSEEACRRLAPAPRDTA